MPAKRKNTRKKASPGQPRAIGKAGSKKQTDPSLKLVLKRLDKFDQRFDMLDQKIEAVDQKVDVIRQESAAEFRAVRGEIAQGRQETAAEFKAVRGEVAQGLDAVRGEVAQGRDAVRGEMAKGFDSLRHEFKTELQKEFENYGAKTFPIYARLESKTNSLEERVSIFNQQFTGMEVMGKNYEQFMRDRDIIDAEHRDLKKDVENLKKRDMEKAAAIDKIEKEIDKLKAA